jgi:CRISPR type IV-associated protein Csf1
MNYMEKVKENGISLNIVPSTLTGLLTASRLFAGNRHKTGTQRCWFCGVHCDETYSAQDYIKSTFTNYDLAKQPQSKHVCQGCIESLGQGEDEMVMLDGTIKRRENQRGMQPRMYSWILTADGRTAFTKAHIALARARMAFNPPAPPFAIVLADTGQQQLIFRAPVALNQECYPVMLEQEEITVIPSLLKERLEIITPVIAALGKPAILGDITIGSYIAYEKYHGNTTGLEKWVEIKNEPLSRLAAWLGKTKEEAQYECHSSNGSGVSQKAIGLNRPAQSDAGDGIPAGHGRSDQILFDFA